MTRIFAHCAAAGVLALFAMLGAFAQVPVEATQDVSTEGVPYLTGGVGEPERKQIEAAAKGYNLKLVFAQSSGAFVANVQVAIKNGTGSTVLEATSNGPLFFAKLAAGNYRVEATYEGVAKQNSASVPATGQRVLDFRW